jgi:hypothetical protein
MDKLLEREEVNLSLVKKARVDRTFITDIQGGENLMVKPMVVEKQSLLTCPHCDHQETEIMPTDACQFFYNCKGCGVLLRPRDNDCCVFCSYGDVPCPPIQRAQAQERESGCCG